MSGAAVDKKEKVYVQISSKHNFFSVPKFFKVISRKVRHQVAKVLEIENKSSRLVIKSDWSRTMLNVYKQYC